MKPFLHSRTAVKRWGGKPEDYQAINDFIDHSKSAIADVRHRAILHSAFGCYLVEQVFGTTITNSDHVEVSTRDIAEEHIKEDLGFIPTAEHWLKNMRIEPWMGGEKKYKRFKPASFNFDND
jgi:hypothetical protein